MLNKQFEERSIENEKLLEIVTNTENFEEDSLSLKRNRSFTVNNTTKYCNTNLFEDKVLSFKYSQTEIKADSLIKQITSADQVNLLTNKELKEEISMEIKAQNKVTNCKKGEEAKQEKEEIKCSRALKEPMIQKEKSFGETQIKLVRDTTKQITMETIHKVVRNKAHLLDTFELESLLNIYISRDPELAKESIIALSVYVSEFIKTEVIFKLKKAGINLLERRGEDGKFHFIQSDYSALLTINLFYDTFKKLISLLKGTFAAALSLLCQSLKTQIMIWEDFFSQLFFIIIFDNPLSCLLISAMFVDFISLDLLIAAKALLEEANKLLILNTSIFKSEEFFAVFKYGDKNFNFVSFLLNVTASLSEFKGKVFGDFKIGYNEKESGIVFEINGKEYPATMKKGPYYKSIDDLYNFIVSNGPENKENLNISNEVNTKPLAVTKKKILKKKIVKKIVNKAEQVANKNEIGNSGTTHSHKVEKEIQNFKQTLIRNSVHANEIRKIKPKISKGWLLTLPK